jgi:hypothetical protein
MATTVITGRDVTFTIGGNNFDAQATSAVLSNSPTMVRYQTLDGVVNRHIDDEWTFAVDMLADWGAASSLCETLWGATESAPNTGISTVLTAASGAVFTFQVLPVFPSAGGSAPDAQTVTMSFVVIGTPAENFS